MKIKALVPFSNGTLSMEQYEVREVTDSLGNELIAAGVAVEIGGGSGGGPLVVHDVDGTLDKTWQEIKDAMLVGGVVIDDGTNSFCVIGAVLDGRSETYIVSTCTFAGTFLRAYTTSSASGYPTASH